MFKKIFENIYMVGGPEYSDTGDCCVYLLQSNVSILIDSGLGKKTYKILDNICEAGIVPSEIKYLILTHCHIDHIGGAKKIKEETGATIIAHEYDAEAIIRGDSSLTAANWYNIETNGIEIDTILKGNYGQINTEPIIEWYHIPGHTPGSIAIMLRYKDKKILFGQDIHGPLSGEFRSNRNDYIKSLQSLIALDVDILCEGHYGIINGRERVKKFIQQFIGE